MSKREEFIDKTDRRKIPKLTYCATSNRLRENL